MQQSIRFKGLSLTPDEMAVENGALSLCGNLELHDGALRPSFVSGTTLANSLVTGDNSRVAKLTYIHETGNYRHLIAVVKETISIKTGTTVSKSKMTRIYWFNEDGSAGKSLPIYTFSSTSNFIEITSISSVGNTLVVTTPTGVFYSLWKDSDYQWLGQKPPFIEINFSTSISDTPENYNNGGVDADGSSSGFRDAFQQTTYGCGDIFNRVKMNILDVTNATEDGVECLTIKEDKQSDVTQSIYALVNRTNNLIARNGRFYANFFVRYCYRMFDGSMIMHSSPVFIPVQVPGSYIVYCANATNPVWSSTTEYVNLNDTITFKRYDGKNQLNEVRITKASFIYSPRNVELNYSIPDVSSNIKELEKWNDVIKSIDVFITPPITNIDTSEKISSIKLYTKYYGLGRSELETYYVNTSDERKKHVITVAFPRLTADAYSDKLKNSSAFYKICSLKISDLNVATTGLLPVDKNAVYQVSLQEQMKDDYKTHNYLFAQGGYVYNHRLNLYGVKEQLFQGFSYSVMFPALNMLKYGETKYLYKINKIVVKLNTTSGTKYVENTKLSTMIYGFDIYMICNLVKFYPDSRAEKMALFCTDTSDNSVIFAFSLDACEELNGAMHMGDFSDNFDQYKVSSFDYSVDDVVEMQNKIYTSESDNAFYFPLNGINTVGIGTIKGIASTTRALSQGQFGQYPLMAFSTDGIWALDVSSSGTYSNIQPISREVCSNPKSITQLDQSVAFATNRSFSRVAESQVASMSDSLDGPGFDIVSNLGKFFNFFNNAEGDTDETKAVKAQMRKLIDFTSSPIDFFQDCQVIYDYKNSRLFCVDVSDENMDESGDTVALCFSIKDNAWSTFLIKSVLTAVNSYPSPYIQFRDGSVTVLDKGYDYSDDTEYHGIIVTRTLKFDEDCAPDAITGYIHSLTTGTVPVMWIYGSNDNQHWHYAGRVGGMKSSYMASHSYRFFRIALYLRMKSMHQYFATRLEVIRRFNKF